MRGRTAWKPRKPTPSSRRSACRSRRTRDERDLSPAKAPVLRQGCGAFSRALPEGRRRRLSLRRSHDSDPPRTPERPRVGTHVSRIPSPNPRGKTREKLAKSDGSGIRWVNSPSRSSRRLRTPSRRAEWLRLTRFWAADAFNTWWPHGETSPASSAHWGFPTRRSLTCLGWTTRRLCTCVGRGGSRDEEGRASDIGISVRPTRAVLPNAGLLRPAWPESRQGQWPRSQVDPRAGGNTREDCCPAVERPEGTTGDQQPASGWLCVRLGPLIREFRYAVRPEYAPWMADAACADMDPDVFFYPDNRTGGSYYDEARAACASCPVLTECREWGDRVESAIPPSGWFGMLAGETPSERKARRHRPNQSKYLKPACRHGHPYDEANTHIHTRLDGVIHRRCRTCNRARVYRGEASRGRARLTGKGPAG